MSQMRTKRCSCKFQKTYLQNKYFLHGNIALVDHCNPPNPLSGCRTIHKQLYSKCFALCTYIYLYKCMPQVYSLSVSHLFISPIHLSFLFPLPFIFRETGNPFKFWRVVPRAYSPLLSRMLRRCCCEEVIKVQVIFPFSLLWQVKHYPFSQLEA